VTKPDTNLPVAYSVAGPAFEPPWPGNFPSGTNTVVMVVVGMPDNTNCAPVTNRFTITVVGTPGPVRLNLAGYDDTTKATSRAAVCWRSRRRWVCPSAVWLFCLPVVESWE